MSDNEEQHTAGIPERPRGQRMGRGGNPDRNREEMQDEALTPALRGIRPEENEFFGDNSAQHVGADPVTPRSNTPSVPATLPVGEPLGQSGGERQAKQQIADAQKGES